MGHHPLPISDKTAANLSIRIENSQFSVVDVETTGLFPERNDRIIEIAVVRVNSTGDVIDQYTTLVNPNRDLGPTPIHGITGRDVRNAPAFGEIAGDVLLRLGGAVFAGYNATFDFRFLRSEMRRIRHDIPDSQVLCVMRLASRVAPNLAGRKLEVCCRHFNVPLADAHSAYCDASATAKVLCECLKKMKSQGNTLLNDLTIEPLPGKEELWPYLPVTGKSCLRSDAAVAAESEVSYIEKLVASLPLTANRDPNLDEYLALLDRVLEDRLVTADEAHLLLCLAGDLGISQEQAGRAHRHYLHDLVRLALADGIVTDREKEDLREVSRLLSISETELEKLIIKVRAATPVDSESGHRSVMPADDIAGMTICFTGTFTCQIDGRAVSRDYAEAVAQQKGMTVRRGVTQDLDMLVVADPNSMSGKAKKARQYGIRIVAEPVFWRMMGIEIS